MVSQSLIPVGIFLALLVCLPFMVKWVKRRSEMGPRELGGQGRFISAVAVGPHQRVVTVEVGPDGARVWLTLGVTSQAITCLHTAPVDASLPAVGGIVPAQQVVTV